MTTHFRTETVSIALRDHWQFLQLEPGLFFAVVLGGPCSGAATQTKFRGQAMKPSRRAATAAQRARTRKPESRRGTKIDAVAEIANWRGVARVEALSEFLKQTDGLKWTKELFLVLLEELYISDEFDRIIGPPENLPAKRWPQAVALAIVLRHSWLPDDLGAITTALSPRPSPRTSSEQRASHPPVGRSRATTRPWGEARTSTTMALHCCRENADRDYARGSAMAVLLSVTEGKELIRLCADGRLYQIEAWIRAGKSLVVPPEVRKKPLAVAISTGFHSLVELLLRHEESQEAKNECTPACAVLESPGIRRTRLGPWRRRSPPCRSSTSLMTGDRVARHVVPGTRC